MCIKIQTGRGLNTKTWFYIGWWDYGFKFGIILFDNWIIIYDKHRKRLRGGSHE